MFLWCREGQAHTAAVGLDVTCIRADNSNGNMSTVSTEEESDGMNNEGGREGGERERTAGTKIGVS